MSGKTTPWDMADHIKTPEDEAAYLEAALEDGDTAVFLEVLGAIIRARGAAKVAKKSGMHRRTAYTIRKGANPTLSTLKCLLDEVGLQLTVRPLPVKVTAKTKHPSPVKVMQKVMRHGLKDDAVKTLERIGAGAIKTSTKAASKGRRAANPSGAAKVGRVAG